MIDLWIRSQDKKELTKVDKLHYLAHRNRVEKGNFYIYCQNALALGNYETEERCIEIINDIQRHLLLQNEYSLKIIIYEMPEK